MQIILLDKQDVGAQWDNGSGKCLNLDFTLHTTPKKQFWARNVLCLSSMVPASSLAQTPADQRVRADHTPGQAGCGRPVGPGPTALNVTLILNPKS